MPWRAVKSHLEGTLQKVRDLWPTEIQDLPMNEEDKQKLKEHWRALHPDFRIS